MLQDGFLGKESPRQGSWEVKRALERNTCRRMEKDARWGREKSSHMQTNASPDHLHKGTDLVGLWVLCFSQVQEAQMTGCLASTLSQEGQVTVPGQATWFPSAL